MERKFVKPDLSAAPKLAFEDVEVPEWNGFVRVQEMTGTERDAWEESCVTLKPDGSSQRNLKNVRARLVARCLVDPETGKRLFSDAEAEALGKQPARVLVKLFEVARSVNKVSDQDVEELAGKSDAAPASDSSTSSAES